MERRRAKNARTGMHAVYKLISEPRNE